MFEYSQISGLFKLLGTFLLNYNLFVLRLGSAHSLFGEAAVLVCNRLMASWKSELGSALAAMEVLSTLARINLTNKNALMCKRTVNWICEFVVFQCSRPAPAHSKVSSHTFI